MFYDKYYSVSTAWQCKQPCAGTLRHSNPPLLYNVQNNRSRRIRPEAINDDKSRRGDAR